MLITPVFAENLRSQSGVHAYFMWIAGQGMAGYSATFRSLDLSATPILIIMRYHTSSVDPNMVCMSFGSL